MEDKIKVEEKFEQAAVDSAIKAMQRCLEGDDSTCESCQPDAKAALEGSGAKAELWSGLKEMVCFDSLPASDMEVCIQSSIDAFMNATDGAFLGDESYGKIKRSCGQSSRDAFEEVGGDVEDWFEASEGKCCYWCWLTCQLLCSFAWFASRATGVPRPREGGQRAASHTHTPCPRRCVQYIQ